MPWNEPGAGGKNNDPWGGKKEQGPPALDKIFTDLLKKLNQFFKGGKRQSSSWQPSTNQSIGFVATILGTLIVVIWFLSGFFIVNPAEEAVILRFGKYLEVLSPGLHWIPRVVDQRYLVDVQKIYSFSLEGDFLTKSSDQNDLQNPYTQFDTIKKISELSDQSKNLVNVELTVQYRISNPVAYLFNVVGPDGTIKSVAASALSDVVGQMKLDEVLTTGREMLSAGVMDRIKGILVSYKTGLDVVAVTLRKVQAPNQVRAAFNDVNRADQDKATYIQQAQAYASRVIPLAQGQAARTLADASAYQQKVTLNAEAHIAKYQALLKAYTASPDVTKQRMYFETMQNVLQKTSKIIVNVNAGNNLIYLPLDKLISKDNMAISSSKNEEIKHDTH